MLTEKAAPGNGDAPYANLALQVSFAEDQTDIFEDMRVQALQAEPEKAVDYLEYVVNYYTSGSKQVKGSKLDRIVERARRNAIAAIIAALRKKTGEDFGDDAQAWIDHYKAKE
jgi:hypothetical protein